MKKLKIKKRKQDGRMKKWKNKSGRMKERVGKRIKKMKEKNKKMKKKVGKKKIALDYWKKY